jgi:hypothetical protein
LQTSPPFLAATSSRSRFSKASHGYQSADGDCCPCRRLAEASFPIAKEDLTFLSSWLWRTGVLHLLFLRSICLTIALFASTSTFLSEQISHQQPASNTFLSEQTNTSHQSTAKRTGRIFPFSDSPIPSPAAASRRRRAELPSHSQIA